MFSRVVDLNRMSGQTSNLSRRDVGFLVQKRTDRTICRRLNGGAEVLDIIWFALHTDALH